MSDSNAQFRNSLFCSYFNDPKRLLSLCNALLNTHYSDPAELEITTLDGIFFDDRKNDISCKIRQLFLVLIEHQSSVNLNMPFRCLAYLTDLLNKLIKKTNGFAIFVSFLLNSSSCTTAMTFRLNLSSLSLTLTIL